MVSRLQTAQFAVVGYRGVLVQIQAKSGDSTTELP